MTMEILSTAPATILMEETEAAIETTLQAVESFIVSRLMKIIRSGDTPQIQGEVVVQQERAKVTIHLKML